MQYCLTENRDPDARWLKLEDFVANVGIEVIVRFVVVENTMYALLFTITRDSGLYLEVGCCGMFVMSISLK